MLPKSTIILYIIYCLTLLLPLASTTKKHKSQANLTRKRKTKCTNSDHFNFEAIAPRYSSSLSYCQHYRSRTCCNKTHTDRIIQSIYGAMEQNFSLDCRDKTVKIGCSPCDPRIGTEQMAGICLSHCNDWYAACSEDYFHFGKHGRLVACPEHSLVCAQLAAFVSGGEQMCQLAGFRVSHQSINCFDGRLPDSQATRRRRHSFSFSLLDELYRRWRVTSHLIYARFLRLQQWQQFLVLVTFLWMLFSLLNLIRRLMYRVSYRMNDPSRTEDSGQALRDKRLKYLAKQVQTNNQRNLERKMVDLIGMRDDDTETDSDSSDSNS